MTNHKREGTSLSGWCSAAPGARIPHTGCRFDLCSCDCHARTGSRVLNDSDTAETRQRGGAA